MKDIRKLKEQVDEKLENIIEQGVQGSNLDVLGKLVDIKKDLEEIKCYEEKGEEDTNYSRGGNEYGRRGVPGTGRGRRRSYSRRGNYRGEEMIDEMYGAYQEYSEGSEEYSNGNYGAKDATMESLEYMLKSIVEFIKMLKKEANSQEEVKLIKEYTEEIAEM